MKMLILIGFIAVSCTSAPNKKCIVQKNQVRVIKTEKSTAFKYLQGIWIIPHAADIRIVFKNDSTFEFHDYNSIKDSIEILKGIYVLNNDQLTLRYTDRPQQKFIYHFGRYEDERYIRKGKYYFVKLTHFYRTLPQKEKISTSVNDISIKKSMAKGLPCFFG